MSSKKQKFRLAFLGSTGVGKDTCVNILKARYPNLSIHIIRLAEPLYQAQDCIYRLCRKQKEYYAQDGSLLNFLGQKMRQINPRVLQEAFVEALKDFHPSAELTICCDVRPMDVAFVRSEGFFIVHIVTDPAIALQRREARGDLSLGNSSHVTEGGISSDLYDYQITNNGTREELESQLIHLIESRAAL